jgi:hypothetical protein
MLKVQTGALAPASIKGRATNKDLPPGYNDGNQWTCKFLPTYLKVLGGNQPNAWSLESDKENLCILQSIWNKVYRSPRLPHVVVQGGGVWRQVSL